jgi:hypothetical protein
VTSGHPHLATLSVLSPAQDRCSTSHIFHHSGFLQASTWRPRHCRPLCEISLLPSFTETQSGTLGTLAKISITIGTRATSANPGENSHPSGDLLCFECVLYTSGLETVPKVLCGRYLRGGILGGDWRGLVHSRGLLWPWPGYKSEFSLACLLSVLPHDAICRHVVESALGLSTLIIINKLL